MARHRFGLAGAFVSYISIALIILFAAMAVVTLYYQRDGYREQLSESSDMVAQMTEESVSVAMTRQKARIEWLGAFLAAAAPEAVYSSDLSLLLQYCILISQNPEIRYIAFRSKKGDELAATGDSTKTVETISLSFPIKAGEEIIGELQLMYSLASLHAEANAVRAQNAKRIEHMNESADNSMRATLKVIAATLIVSAFIVAGVVLVMFRHLVMRRLAFMATRFREIAAGSGDLSARITVDGEDEIDQLGLQFNTLLDKLHRSMSQVLAETANITSSSQTLAESSSLSASRLNEAQAATEHVSAAITQMSTAISGVAERAERAANTAVEVAGEGEVGASTLTAAIASIEKLSLEAHQVSASLSQLGADATQIGGVVEVIKSVAEQTNLLALNAAIEAARAGEHGRGFAVVADEVRTLSQRTQQSTQEIQSVVEQLQARVRSVITLIGAQEGATRNVACQATEAGSTISTIIRGLSSIASVSSEIASSISEQRRAVDEIDRNVASISGITTETSADVQAASEASQSLSAVATQLHSITKAFNL